ncbi:MAG: GTPase HflX [Eubacterium sp.]|nr:GTPase HflX [Eubacterium sp.]
MTENKKQASIDTAEKKEKTILVAVALGETSDTEDSLDELCELADTAGAEVIGRVMQQREAFHPGTYIGKGKIEELKELIDIWQADSVICDDELSPAQMKNLSDMLKVKVIDRTVLILDIFAAHAATSEGKLQVELAQLRYRSSHLIGMGQILSRQGGGIGTRGPGETKLEVDRRQIRNRISVLNAKLKEVVKNRDTQRAGRESSGIPTIAIVGYTNAGKSTLLNKLTGSDVLSEDKLFATLDTTTRKYELEDGQTLLFTDTVGFINKLPHTLIKAFRSTLEEAGYADILLHVVDSSNPNLDTQMKVVYDTLKELDINDKPIITAFNKTDLLKNSDEVLKDNKADATVHISAKTGAGTDELIQIIDEKINASMIHIEKLISFGDAGNVQYIRQHGKLINEEYREDGIYVEAYIPAEGMYIFK